MELLEEIVRDQSDTIHRARLLYTLSRMEPEQTNKVQLEVYRKFISMMYEYTKDKEATRELLTAIHVLIYGLREKGQREEYHG